MPWYRLMWHTEGIRQKLAHAFAVDSGADFTDEETALVERLAGFVV